MAAGKVGPQGGMAYPPEGLVNVLTEDFIQLLAGFLLDSVVSGDITPCLINDADLVVIQRHRTLVVAKLTGAAGAAVAQGILALLLAGLPIVFP
jgi:hypothetical protein